jgi:hypothetical protein
MPRYDRTGPTGAGPGTGWGRGNCRQRPGMNRFAGPGDSGGMSGGGRPGGSFGGRGFGLRGWWRGFWGQSASPTEDVESLKTALSTAKEEIAVMEARLAELEKKE